MKKMPFLCNWLVVAGFAWLAACVTINVYFPAAAAEKAADRIIQDVWGNDPKGENLPPLLDELDTPPPTGWLERMLDIVIPPAYAQANLSISTPTILKLRDAMAARHNWLMPFYNSGGIGLTEDGLIAVRDLNAVPLSLRRPVQEFVAEENRDRNTLYQAIAEANGHPEWENDIRSTFARKWIANAPSGWWVRQDGWRQKP